MSRIPKILNKQSNSLPGTAVAAKIDSATGELIWQHHGALELLPPESFYVNSIPKLGPLSNIFKRLDGSIIVQDYRNFHTLVETNGRIETAIQGALLPEGEDEFQRTQGLSSLQLRKVLFREDFVCAVYTTGLSRVYYACVVFSPELDFLYTVRASDIPTGLTSSGSFNFIDPSFFPQSSTIFYSPPLRESVEGSIIWKLFKFVSGSLSETITVDWSSIRRDPEGGIDITVWVDTLTGFPIVIEDKMYVRLLYAIDVGSEYVVASLDLSSGILTPLTPTLHANPSFSQGSWIETFLDLKHLDGYFFGATQESFVPGLAPDERYPPGILRLVSEDLSSDVEVRTPQLVVDNPRTYKVLSSVIAEGALYILYSDQDRKLLLCKNGLDGSLLTQREFESFDGSLHYVPSHTGFIYLTKPNSIEPSGKWLTKLTTADLTQVYATDAGANESEGGGGSRPNLIGDSDYLYLTYSGSFLTSTPEGNF